MVGSSARAIPAADRPQIRIEQAGEELGRAEVQRRCNALLAGGSEEPAFLAMLGAAPGYRGGGELAPAQRAWLRVWAARGLLWAGPGEDLQTLRAALEDEVWRVREMACKVIARHRLGDLLDDVSRLRADPVARVRSAAGRAVVRIVTADAASSARCGGA